MLADERSMPCKPIVLKFLSGQSGQASEAEHDRDHAFIDGNKP